ncbi:chorismate-pyruvate lyase [Catenulispora sp. GP43]
MPGIHSGLHHGIAGFSAPATRMILANGGLTTPLLEAVAGCELTTQVDSCVLVEAAELREEPRDALAGPEPEAQAYWLRHSRLLTDTGEPVSENIVTARSDLDPAIDRAVQDADHPIGYAMTEAGLALTRRTLHVGSTAWPHGRAPRQRCATKSYILEISGLPALHIQELYSPAYFPSAS